MAISAETQFSDGERFHISVKVRQLLVPPESLGEGGLTKAIHRICIPLAH
jgi:hypothetical protein